MVIFVALLASCTACRSVSDSSSADYDQESTASSKVTTPPPSTEETSAGVDELGIAERVVLDCSDAIASSPPSADVEVIGDVVALPTERAASFALQTSTSGESDARLRLFAKAGLLARSGSTFELRVPATAMAQLAVGWGSFAQPTHRLVANACDPGVGWLAYAGGFWVPRVGCFPIEVMADGVLHEVRVGVGAPCSGQQNPPSPSET